MAGAQELEESITGINVTPLVDVCLVLVIIFMAVAPFAIQAGIKVLQSKSNAAQGKASASENVNAKLTAAGLLTVNGKPTTFEQLQQVLDEAVAASKDKMVIVSAEQKNKVREVVVILDTAKQAGAQKLAIVKEEAAPEAKGG
ncbi:MAG: biopolymer transporter ExbD [Elusimicrobia bacterium]|nr:biopolymer transporter ExbD [Elusimicrobiota bacterium]